MNEITGNMLDAAMRVLKSPSALLCVLCGKISLVLFTAENAEEHGGK